MAEKKDIVTITVEETDDVERSAVAEIDDQTTKDNGENNQPLLPPTDRGRGALLFMVGATMIEAIMWGV